MLQNILGVNTKIDIGDYVFIYKYSDRNNIKSFEDLYKVKVEEISPIGARDKNIIVSGVYETVNDDDQIVYERITGIVAYKSADRLVETSTGIMYGNYYFEKKNQLNDNMTDEKMSNIFLDEKVFEGVRLCQVV